MRSVAWLSTFPTLTLNEELKEKNTFLVDALDLLALLALSKESFEFAKQYHQLATSS